MSGTSCISSKPSKGHDSIVSFHRAVLDDVSEKDLGFTSHFITGGTLLTYQNQPLYFRWLKQLTDAIDDLNFRFRIMHQRISPRNILVEPATGNLKICDFDRATRIGSPKQVRNWNDIDGLIFTIYETLTTDEGYRSAPFGEHQVEKVEALEEWKLDKGPMEEGKGGITAYRRFLGGWVHGRRTTRRIEHYSRGNEPLSWPEYKEPEPIPMFLDTCPTGVPRRRRQDALKAGEYVTCWERPPQGQGPLQLN